MVHHLQIIGEAVRSIDPDFRNKHPSVPWRLISKNRNPEAPFAVAGRRMNSPGTKASYFLNNQSSSVKTTLTIKQVTIGK
jgi:hypothetical protein